MCPFAELVGEETPVRVAAGIVGGGLRVWRGLRVGARDGVEYREVAPHARAHAGHERGSEGGGLLADGGARHAATVDVRVDLAPEGRVRGLDAQRLLDLFNTAFL